MVVKPGSSTVVQRSIHTGYDKSSKIPIGTILSRWKQNRTYFGDRVLEVGCMRNGHGDFWLNSRGWGTWPPQLLDSTVLFNLGFEAILPYGEVFEGHDWKLASFHPNFRGSGCIYLSCWVIFTRNPPFWWDRWPGGPSSFFSRFSDRETTSLQDQPSWFFSLFWLLSIGAQVSAKTSESETPLHHALNGQYLEVAHALLRAGANPSIQTTEGFAPIHLIVQFKPENVELLQRWARPRATPPNFTFFFEPFPFVFGFLGAGLSPCLSL